jgi:gas vesicle protein
MAMSENNRSAENIRAVAGSLLGLGVGTGLGILFAPRSGRATRNRIRDTAEDGRDRVAAEVRHLHTSAEGFLKDGLEALDRQKDRVAAAISKP